MLPIDFRRMRHEFQKLVLDTMEVAFRRLEAAVPPPVRKPWKGGSFVFRYAEQSCEQAIVQKLARVISGLLAADVLHAQGFFQEQGALYRMLDEINEDVLFLVVGLTEESLTPEHEQYLTAFYEDQMPEGWAAGTPVKGPNTPPRKAVRRVLRQRGFPDGAPMEQVSKAYSGYIHAASQNVMAMCGGDPPRFSVRGMLGTHAENDHANDSWNYVYRGLASFVAAAMAFNDEPLLKVLQHMLKRLEQVMGIGDEVTRSQPPSQ